MKELIGLIDIDSKIPNLALIKISSYYKSLCEEVEFVKDDYMERGERYEKIYASAIFTKSRLICNDLKKRYGDKIEIGGTGCDLDKVLDGIIEHMKPDYDLYNAEDIASRMKGIGTKEHKLKKATEIVSAGMGFTSRGCVRACGFCFVP